MAKTFPKLERKFASLLLSLSLQVLVSYFAWVREPKLMLERGMRMGLSTALKASLRSIPRRKRIKHTPDSVPKLSLYLSLRKSLVAGTQHWVGPAWACGPG